MNTFDSALVSELGIALPLEWLAMRFHSAAAPIITLTSHHESRHRHRTIEPIAELKLKSNSLALEHRETSMPQEAVPLPKEDEIFAVVKSSCHGCRESAGLVLDEEEITTFLTSLNDQESLWSKLSSDHGTKVYPPPPCRQSSCADANLVTSKIRYFPSRSKFDRDSFAPQFRLRLPCCT